jgi:hypothetical protein
MELSVQGKSWLIGILVLLVAGVGAFAQTPTTLSYAGDWNQRSQTAARSLVSDHQRLVAIQPPDPSSLEPSEEIVLEPIELVSFELSNGSTVKLLAVPELSELGYVEITQVGAEPVLPGQGELRPLEVFLALAPLETPIPQALIDLDTQGNAESLATGRQRTDRVSEPIPVGIDDLGLRNLAGASGSCGSGGGSYFAINYCKAQLGHNCNLIDFCDASYNGGDTVWFSLNRGSYSGGWLMRRASYGWTAACGTTVRVRQQYWVSGAWVNLSTTDVNSGQVVYVYWEVPNAYRRILRSRLTGSGGFRAYTNFHNDC